jgi:hypothetical protein
MVGQHSIHEAKLLLHQNQFRAWIYPEDIGEILGAMQAYRLYKEQPGGRERKHDPELCMRRSTWIFRPA